MSRSAKFFACVFLAMGVDLYAQTSTANYTLVPQTVSANQAFDLTLKNPKFDCTTRFSNLSVAHNGNVLNLSFKAVQTAIPCPVSDTLHGPTLSIPGLATGSDSVFAIQQPACAPVCQIIVLARQFAGILYVTAPVNGTGWFILPRQAASKNSFTLQLLNDAYGSCQTGFTHDSLSLQNGSLYASFVIVSNPGNTCMTEVRPFGPSYPVPGLNTGKYPVYGVQHLSCEYTNPRCLVAIQPFLVDTLSILMPTLILPSLKEIHRPAQQEPLGSVQDNWINGRKAFP